MNIGLKSHINSSIDKRNIITGKKYSCVKNIGLKSYTS